MTTKGAAPATARKRRAKPEEDEEEHERLARTEIEKKKQKQSLLSFGTKAPAAPTPADEDEDEDEDEDDGDLDMTFLKPSTDKAKSTKGFSAIHTDKPKGGKASQPATSADVAAGKQSKKPAKGKKPASDGLKQQTLMVTGGEVVNASGSGSREDDETAGLVDEDDVLAKMLASKAKRENADEEMRERVAAEVDSMMDNGVVINPLLRATFGGKAKG